MNLRYTDVNIPEIKENEVLVRVKACGICGSDVHGYDGSTGRRNPPLIMGHEASGVVEHVGRKVSGWKPGDRITFDSTVYPQDDWFTRRGLYNLSDHREVIGVAPAEYKRHGAFAEYVAIPDHILYRVPDKVTFEQAAMVEPVAVALHAVNLTDLDDAEVILVIGAGMIGLFLIQVLKTRFQGKIMAIDLDPEKLKLAKQLGADHAYTPDELSLKESIADLTNARGADIAFEVVGIDQTVQLAINNVRKGGSVTLVGNLSPEVRMPLQQIVTRQIRLQGSCAIAGEYPEVLRMIENGSIDVDVMISHIRPLSEGAAWFEKLYNHEPGLKKVILVP